MEKIEMEIKCAYDKLVPLVEIQPNPTNPNSHPDAQIKMLAKIITYQGMRRPIIISERSGFVIVGHGRLLALKLMGVESAPVNYQKYDNEAQEYADMIADNAISSWSSLDMPQINADFLKHGPELDVDMLGLKNFTIEPMDKILPRPSTPEDILPKQPGVVVNTCPKCSFEF